MKTEETMSAELLDHAIANAHAVLANVRTDQLDQPTPCASWDVRGLINHMVGSSDWFAATITTGVAPGGDFHNDVTSGDFVAAYDAAAAAALDAFRAPQATEKTVKLPFGEMPGAAFLMMAANDTFQHAWDLTHATGQSPDVLDQILAAQLLDFALAAIPDMLRGPDGQAPFGPTVQISETATPADRLAAFLGRTP
jgi:uncharacterized protein (TIGR03086 family)